MSATTSPAAGLLGSMLAGVGDTHRMMGADAPTLTVDELQPDGDNAVSAKVQLASGDTFLVRIEWLQDESP